MTASDATIYATSDTPLGNGAFTPDGRLVVSHHPMYETAHRVSIFNADGSLSPYPTKAWNTPGDDPMTSLDAVLGLRADSLGRIWLADMGTRSGIQPKFVVWDTNADTLWRVIPLPADVTTSFSEPNDFVIDERRSKLYISDEGAGGGGDGSRAALIVLDIATGSAARRLDGFDGVRDEPQPLTINGEPVERNNSDGSRTPLHVGLDGIAMDPYRRELAGRSLLRPYSPMARAIPISNCTAIFPCALNVWGMLRDDHAIVGQPWDDGFRCVDFASGDDAAPMEGECARLREDSKAFFPTLPNRRPNR